MDNDYICQSFCPRDERKQVGRPQFMNRVHKKYAAIHITSNKYSLTLRNVLNRLTLYNLLVLAYTRA